MKIYFAGAIRGGRQHAATYHELVSYIATRAQVLTEHIGESDLSAQGEQRLTDQQIYERDMHWRDICATNASDTARLRCRLGSDWLYFISMK